MLLSRKDREILLRARLDNLLQERERLGNPEPSELAEPLRMARLANKDRDIRLVLDELSGLPASTASGL